MPRVLNAVRANISIPKAMMQSSIACLVRQGRFPLCWGRIPKACASDVPQVNFLKFRAAIQRMTVCTAVWASTHRRQAPAVPKYASSAELESTPPLSELHQTYIAWTAVRASIPRRLAIKLSRTVRHAVQDTTLQLQGPRRPARARRALLASTQGLRQLCRSRLACRALQASTARHQVHRMKTCVRIALLASMWRRRAAKCAFRVEPAHIRGQLGLRRGLHARPAQQASIRPQRVMPMNMAV